MELSQEQLRWQGRPSPPLCSEALGTQFRLSTRLSCARGQSTLAALITNQRLVLK